MRKLITVLFLFFFSFSVCAQQGPQALFDQANGYLEEGAYSDALNLYKGIERLGYKSGPLFLNMGIAATEIDSLGLAKAYLLRAVEYNETEDRAQEALEFVNSQFSRQSAILKKLPWDLAVQWMIKRPGPRGVFYFGIVLILLSMTILFGRWFGKLKDKKFKTSALSVLSTGIIILGLAFYSDYVDARYDEAVLTDDEIRVRSNADMDADLVSMAYEGYDLVVDQKISREKTGWLFVRLGNGQYGWIQDEGIKII
ncbi:hypothetical protein AB2B38_011060 [Balneola sp. MJW-20]|uniref:hypothetical protein n=1 Tax=Gracilimonas aurantiaca TaxID=3234185 RepID=UPI003466A49F